MVGNPVFLVFGLAVALRPTRTAPSRLILNFPIDRWVILVGDWYLIPRYVVYRVFVHAWSSRRVTAVYSSVLGFLKTEAAERVPSIFQSCLAYYDVPMYFWPRAISAGYNHKFFCWRVLLLMRNVVTDALLNINRLYSYVAALYLV